MNKPKLASCLRVMHFRARMKMNRVNLFKKENSHHLEKSLFDILAFSLRN